MLRLFFSTACLSLLSLTLQGQKALAWPVLAMTTYEQNPQTGQYQPDFPSVLESQYAGEEVVIAGYLIPMDLDNQTYALSKNPFSSCFFCGNAGPETVIELRFRDAPGRFATDRYLPIVGTLVLHRHPQQLFYTIKDARIQG